MKIVPVTLLAASVAITFLPSGAISNEGRFVELPSPHNTVTYDLDTVHVMQPGRFTVVSRTIDNPEVMKFELKVADTLRLYCSRTAGNYPPPADLFTLGPPDKPVKNIEVITSGRQYPVVMWLYPYERVPKSGTVFCNDQMEMRSRVLNGDHYKMLFDCSRGIVGVFLDGSPSENPDEPTVAFLITERLGQQYFDDYLAVCQRVAGKAPYIPS